MNITPQELAEVEAASKREAEHATAHPKGLCGCLTCDSDRLTIAKHAPAVLRLLRDYIRTQTRGDACGGMG